MTGGNSSDTGTDSSAGEGVVSVWRRWTDDEAVPFHEYCSLRPVSLPPVLGLGARHPEGEEPPLSYTPPLARWALKHTPLLVLLAMFWKVLADYGTRIASLLIEIIQSVLSPTTALVVVVFVAWIALLARLVRSVLQTPETNTLQSLVVHGLSVVLTVGLLLNMYVAVPQEPIPLSAETQAMISSFGFPFYWMLFFGGHLVYDGMLRTENMFDQLEQKQPQIIAPGSDYGAFLESLKEDLNDTLEIGTSLSSRVKRGPAGVLPVEVKGAYLFAALFVTPFFLIGWLFPSAPNPNPSILLRGGTHLVVAVLNFFLVVVFFQFLVLIAYFNRLLSDRATETGASVTLVYNPRHHDDYAGFRDFGHFATRVNVLLGIGGIYIVNYLYGGLQGYPGLGDYVTLEFMAWAVGTFFPLLTYVFAVFIWFYLSFWQMHKRMKRGRERLLEELARKENDPDMEIRNGPVWPLNSQGLLSNISIDLLPLLSFLPFIRV